MAASVQRSTVYLDSVLHKALRLKSVETSRSMSELVNAAVRESLAEDAEDWRPSTSVPASHWSALKTCSRG